MSRMTTWGLFLAILSGCGAEAPAKPLPSTVPVSGVVVMNGKPLSSATVTFVPIGNTKGIECVGQTDDAGRYSLSQIRGGVGAPPGEYRVVVNRYVKPGGAVVAVGMGEFPADVGAVESLPPRFSSMTDSTLTATVPPMGGEVSVELKGR